MFRLACVVEDKNLPKVLHALSGLVLNMEVPVPLGNATVTRGKVVQAHPSTSFKGRVASKLAAHPTNEISKAEIEAIIKEVGGNIAGYPSLIQQLRTDKHIKLKRRGLWLIQKKG